MLEHVTWGRLLCLLPTGLIFSCLDQFRCGLASRQEAELDDLLGSLPALGFQTDINIWGVTVAESSHWLKASSNRVAQSGQSTGS